MPTGTVVPASHYGLPGDWPPEVVMTVTLEERDGRTMMTVREEGIPKEMRGPGEARPEAVRRQARRVPGGGTIIIDDTAGQRSHIPHPVDHLVKTREGRGDSAGGYPAAISPV